MSLEHFVITLGSGLGITYLAYNNDFQAPFALGATTVTLAGLDLVLFKYIISPTWYQWVCNERNGLAVEKFMGAPTDRVLANILKELTGSIALSAWLGCTFRMTSVGEACWICFILYLGSVLPNIHHYMWEGRRTPLLAFSELHQCLRRLVAAAGMVVFANLFDETLNGKQYVPFAFPQISIVAVVIMTVFRFFLGMIWYGPLFGESIWLPAMQEWLGDPTFPSEESNSDIPKLLGAGIVCGLLSTVVLLAVQVQTGWESDARGALSMAGQLFAFFVLPTISVDGWEGKGYAMSFVNYGICLVELCLVLLLGAVFG
uniref:Uncharacterized protein n=1 Tax=Grammatophora oceanica TaxID=210454 RepID=A0A7S1UWM5_9STRA|mmetsp:Transcript_27386/g.40130  ORF Transcript_27386/g.40130 Transcript_27386/m.40130 type:complete len:316 (+) Transcript_27386:87-1034(+)